MDYNYEYLLREKIPHNSHKDYGGFLLCKSYCFKQLLLVESEVSLNSASNRATNHRVVTDAEEAHHLNVGRN